MATITGSVSYRQRIALPEGAVVQVRVEDISRQDAPSEVIAESSTPVGVGQVPLPFVVEVDDALIEPSHRYAVRARVTVAERLLFTTDTVHPVLTHDAPNEATITLVAVPRTDPQARPSI